MLLALGQRSIAVFSVASSARISSPCGDVQRSLVFRLARFLTSRSH